MLSFGTTFLILVAFGPCVIQMLLAYLKCGRATYFHKYLAKLSALTQHVLILRSFFFFFEYTLCNIIIAIGLRIKFEEVTLIFGYVNWTSDVKGISWAHRDKRNLKKFTE